MATIPVYTTFTAGAVLTAAQLNSQVVNAGNFLTERPYCAAFDSAIISTAGASVFVLAPLDTETEDTDNMHNPASNNSRIVFQTLGVFRGHMFAGWASHADVFARVIRLNLNAAGSPTGGTKLGDTGVQNISGGFSLNFQVQMPFEYRALNIGDYVEMFVTQNAGTALNTVAGGVGMSWMWEIA